MRSTVPNAVGFIGDELRRMGSCHEVPSARRETGVTSPLISTMALEGDEGLGEPSDDISYTMHHKP